MYDNIINDLKNKKNNKMRKLFNISKIRHQLNYETINNKISYLYYFFNSFLIKLTYINIFFIINTL
jgi:hypothetical protein